MPKHFILIVMTVIISVHSVKAQDGLYLSAGDYTNKKMIAADKKTLVYWGKEKTKKMTVTLKVNGVKKEYAQDNMFGVYHDNTLIRFDSLCWYCGFSFYTSRDSFYLWEFVAFGNNGQTDRFLVSIGPTGPLYEIGSDEMLKGVVTKHQEFLPILTGLNNSKRKLFNMKLTGWFYNDPSKK